MKQQVADIVERVGSLPPLPGTALRLIDVMSDPRSTVDQIVEVIKYDESLTSQVLRLCNSAYFGLSRKVTSLNDAMICLGTAKVIQLVMAVHTGAILSKEQVGYGLEPGVLWRHSTAVALASSILGQRIKLPNIGLAFTAGLLHDIGKVILNEYVAEEFSRIVESIRDDRLSFCEAEHRILGFDHQEIGGQVAEKWNLPEQLVACIRCHHTPDEVEGGSALVDVVHLANCLCLMLGIGLGDDGLSCRADAGAMERHDLREHDLEVAGAQTLVELKRVEQMFAGVSDEEGPDRAHRQAGA